MDILLSMLYALVEGASQWIPVSSRANSALLSYWLPMSFSDANTNALFAAVLLGCFLGAAVFYRRRIVPFAMIGSRAESVFSGESDRILCGKIRCKQSVIALWKPVGVCTAVTWIMIFAAKPFVPSAAGRGLVLALTTGAAGVALAMKEDSGETLSKASASLAELPLAQAAALGVVQAVGWIVPGIGAFTAMLFAFLCLGYVRQLGLDFAVILCLPSMLIQSMIGLLQADYMTGYFIMTLLMAVCIAIAVSLLTLRAMTGWYIRHSWKGFGLYRLLVAVFILVQTLMY